MLVEPETVYASGMPVGIYAKTKGVLVIGNGGSGEGRWTGGKAVRKSCKKRRLYCQCQWDGSQRERRPCCSSGTKPEEEKIFLESCVARNILRFPWIQ